MQKRNFIHVIVIYCIFFIKLDLNAQYLCSNATTSLLTNNASSITLSKLGVYPSSGPYSVKLTYADPLTNATVDLNPISTTVNNTGTTLVINYPLGNGIDLTDSKNVSLILTNGTNTFTSGWSFGSCKAALPIKLTSFTAAEQSNGYNLLTWVTAQEAHSDYILVQKSLDRISWTDIGIEPAAGSSSSPITYNFYTTGTLKSTSHYYRLKMVDDDGSFLYSDVKVINGTARTVAADFCAYTKIEGNSTICSGSNVFRVHNATPYVNWSATAGSLSLSHRNTVAILNGCLSANATITASSGCNKSLALYPCAGASLRISGPASICTSATETLIGAPAGAAITWTASPADMVNISCPTCASTVVTRIYNGQVKLTASIATGCGTNSASGNVTVGSSNNLAGTFYTSSGSKTLQTVNFVPAGYVSAQFQWPNVSNINSFASSGGGQTGFYSYSNGFSFNIAQNQQVQVVINGTGACGETVQAIRAFVQSSYMSSYAMQASPNPAKSTINVVLSPVVDTSATAIKNAMAMLSPGASVNSSASPAKSVTRMYLYDFNTNALVKQWSFEEKEPVNRNLNIAGTKPGLYVLKMEWAGKSTTTKIIVQ